ncbi:MAG: endopeptidase La [Candidatus Tectomicrobia bacterium]|uniref:Lon protease n=1 Tax=Tectimicrobiota bacterium TaxID=2528274 RepID=A0A932CQK1_UNCTE|nr:endopeptidase La [Candidatus Tectomicrobia bacterium]
MFSWLRDQDDGAQDPSAVKTMPSVLPILPLRNTVPFPFTVLPLTVGIERSIRLVEEAMGGDRLVGLVAMRDPHVDLPMPGQLYETGTVALIHRAIRSQEGGMQVAVQGLERFKVESWTQTEPYLKARIRIAPDQLEETAEAEALRRSLLEQARQLIQLLPNLPNEMADFLTRIENPRFLVYLIAANVRMEVPEAQEILEADLLSEKMRQLIAVLGRELQVTEIGQKIRSEAQEEVSKAQRDYILREQLKAIQRELGEGDEQQVELAEYRQKIEAAGMSAEAEKEALRELSRLEKMPPQAAEYSVIKTYLDWLCELPWSKRTEDHLDIEWARQVLDEDHYDLEEVKQRILEYLAVRKLLRERGSREEEVFEAQERGAGAILCFVGPPGTGKTSLGQSIARALGRQFTRMSLGGMRDEAEIRGHRRTYIGAMPGRIIQAIKRVGTHNPVFMLDEVDKIGADWRGDPSSALLEVLDPQQNHAFRDHYLDVDFDLSEVMFITTANLLDPIPEPLRDRMEILHLDGYTEYEKLHIARTYLISRQMKANGLQAGELVFTDSALYRIVREYTREAGVRNLERQIGQICRKVATLIASGQAQGTLEIDPERVVEFLGKPKYFEEVAQRTETPGVATGLAVTPAGGEVLFIEATRMRGQHGLTLTGQLGEVMKESAQIALSYVRSRAKEFEIDERLFSKYDLHVHVPAGAVPKDGPSAGVAMVTAIVSLLTDRPVRSDVGMTGEITLQGRVLPIGGVKMKVLAAHRAGLKTVVLPKRNEPDLDELPEDVRREMGFVLVESIDGVLEAALQPELRQPVAEMPSLSSRNADRRSPAVLAEISCEPSMTHDPREGQGER